MPITYPIIGLMSGSSLDGLDMVFARFWQVESNWRGEILVGRTRAFPAILHHGLAKLRQASTVELMDTEIQFLNFCADEVHAFIQSENLSPMAVVSHGHTVFHNPGRKYTFQLGNGGLLSGLLGRTVVSDFRTLDVGFGGQGAPLVPGAELHLFNDWYACLNLGGIANISFPGQNTLPGLDLVACNQVLNLASGWMGLPYDKDGLLAAQGQLIPALEFELNGLEYLQFDAPKSLGNEDVARWWFPVIEKYKSQPKDVLHTLCLHISRTIAAALPPQNKNSRLLLTGGGAHNRFLVNSIQKVLGETWQVVVPDKKMVDWKEAYCFAFLGLCRLLNLPNSPAQNLSLGTIYGQQWLKMPK